MSHESRGMSWSEPFLNLWSLPVSQIESSDLTRHPRLQGLVASDRWPFRCASRMQSRPASLAR